MPLGRFVDDYFGASNSKCLWHGGKVLTLVAELIGIPLDPKKDAESCGELPLLGARVRISQAEAQVHVSVDPTKADDWMRTLRLVRSEGCLESWKAAKFAGRLQFTLGLNFGKIGRASVRPV